MTSVFGLHLILGGKWDVGISDDLFLFLFCLHLILGGKLDVERRDDLFLFLSSPDFGRKMGRRKT